MKLLNKRILLIVCLMLFFTCAVTVTVNAVTIDAPSIKASNLSTSGKIKITWKPVDDALKYKIYRSLDEKGTFKLIKTVSGTKYTNTTAVAGKQYYYYVRAVTKKGKVSAKSNVVKRYCDLKQPVISSITNASSSGKIKLKWSKVDNAVGYKVYRATSKSGKYTLMKTVTGTSYINTTAKAGKYYYYRIRAISSSSSANSAYSKVVSRTCDLQRPDVQISLSDKGFPKLTWDAIEGAVKYEVYRSTSSDGKYKLMKTTSQTVYTNTSVSLDCKYYYKVKAISSKSTANSAYSVVDSVKTREYDIRYVSLHRIFVYEEPSSKSKSISLPYMAEFELGETVYDYSSGKWYKLRYNGNIYYMWVAKGDTKFTDAESTYTYISSNPYAQEIIDLATEICFTWDTHYVNGDSTGTPDSKGRYGFDCSGYVTYCINTVMQKYNPAYRLIGNTKTLYAQNVIYNGGYKGEFSAKTVKLADIIPGDLIFLDMSDEMTGMNHVAIYLGNGELAHISGLWDRVTIMPLKGYFTERTISVRRFIPENVQAADQTVYANASCRLYEKRSDESDVLYTFSKNEEMKVLFTNSNGKWAYVTNNNGVKGFVLTNRVVIEKMKGM